MNIEVYSQGNKINLKNLKGSGGEANVYVHGGKAFKIFHDKKKAVDANKFKELNKISHNDVCKPIDLVYDSHNTILGYYMEYIKNHDNICKLFTKQFKVDNGLNLNNLLSIAGHMQEVTKDIHNSKCLVVDYNELNILVNNQFNKTKFIDVDSYQTPSYKATAIMPSICDYSCKDNFSELSDWYSYSIIIFQMIIGMHPFKGKHPDYKNNDLKSRMKDSISIFNSKVKYNKNVCTDLNIVPSDLLNWFKKLYVENKRVFPPLIDCKGNFMPDIFNIKIHTSSSGFDIELRHTINDHVLYFNNFNGTKVIIGKKGVYINEVLYYQQKFKKTYVLSYSGRLFVIHESDGFIEIWNDNNLIEHINCESCFVNSYGLFYKNNDEIFSCGLNIINKKIFTVKNKIASVSLYSTSLYKNTYCYEAFSSKFFLICYDFEKSRLIRIPELKDYKIIDASFDGSYLVVIGLFNSVYDRYVFSFSNNFEKYSFRKDENISTHVVNFCCHKGMGILVTNDHLEIFNKDNVKIIDNCPIDSSNHIFSVTGNLYFSEFNKINKISLTK